MTSGRTPRRTSRRRGSDAVITTARPGRSSDLTRRQRQYLIAMSIRIGCFVAMIFVPGPARFALLVGAAVLPGFAVLIANAVDQRTHGPSAIEPGGPEDRKALPRESTDVVGGEVIDD